MEQKFWSFRQLNDIEKASAINYLMDGIIQYSNTDNQIMVDKSFQRLGKWVSLLNVSKIDEDIPDVLSNKLITMQSILNPRGHCNSAEPKSIINRFTKKLVENLDNDELEAKRAAKEPSSCIIS